MFSILMAQAGLERTYGALAAIVVVFLHFAVIVSIITGRGTKQHKVLWSLIVMLVPVVGLVLYFAIGRSRADRPLLD